MRVIILAVSPHQGALADRIINHENFSKIILTIQSQKLIDEAQALIVYYECKSDLT
jgi:hypothetical protein